MPLPSPQLDSLGMVMACEHWRAYHLPDRCLLAIHDEIPFHAHSVAVKIYPDGITMICSIGGESATD